jgi:hypothetical protein
VTPAIRPYDRSQLAAANARSSRARPLEASVVETRPSWSVRVEFFNGEAAPVQARGADERIVDERKPVERARYAASSTADRRAIALPQPEPELQLGGRTQFTTADPQRAAAAYTMHALRSDAPQQTAGGTLSVRA